MNRVVMTSPFTGGNKPVEENVKYARKCVADCWFKDEAPFAGHLTYTQGGIMNDENLQRELAIKAEHAWIEISCP